MQVTRAVNLQRADLLDRLIGFLVAGVLWAVFAAMVLPLPAATAGLFAVLTPWVRGEPSEPFQRFFGAMRRTWAKSTLIVLLDAALAALVVVNLNILDNADVPLLPAVVSRSVTRAVGITAALANVYLWPLLVTFDLPLRTLSRVAMRLVFLRPLWSAFAGMLALVPVLAAAVVPAGRCRRAGWNRDAARAAHLRAAGRVGYAARDP
ncbi:MAG TPA: DUF624 domain-containing protein [Aggregatilinea sp.]|uniref:DUF624 domain-containing protein n=1 Tax=Aggregatilinea sp. TaxID=2806333 RepID=UPI002BDB92BF|nr:DUF624 domain-containing protein [Aggregatilinea sp.]HML20268.1 DUF624 domain-containing protein [Aggregatilinea sp.]